MNAVIYRRVSTDSQTGSELTQDAEAVSFCAQQHWPVIADFADPNTSGSIPIAERREGKLLLDFLASQAARQPLALVAIKQDRLGRDSLDQISFIRHIWDLGVLPCLVAEGGPLPRTPDNELKFSLKAVIAQDELNRIRERVILGLRAKRARGELCGTIPYGFDAIPTGEIRRTRSGHEVHVRRLTDNATEQRWIKQMCLWRGFLPSTPNLTHPWSYSCIARELNRLNVRTKEAGRVHNLKGGAVPARSHWQQGNVHRILKNSYTQQLINKWKSESVR